MIRKKTTAYDRMKSASKPKAYTPPSAQQIHREFIATDPGPGENMGGIVLDIVLDVSGSTSQVFPLIAADFNEVCIPAFQEAAESYKKALRIGCTLFGTKVGLGWDGYKTLAQLGQLHPIRPELHSEANLGSLTNLLQGVHDAYRQGQKAAEYLYRKSGGRSISRKMVVLTDGADTERKMSPDALKAVLTTERDTDKFQSLLVFYKTSGGLSRAEFEALSRQIGFQDCFYVDRESNLEKQRADFRHRLNMWSRDASRRIGH
jgi:hypothetical protein